MLIAIVNRSTLVTNSDIEIMVKAINIQLLEHFLPAWNLKSGTVQFYANEAQVPGYAAIIYIVDNDAAVAGALGFHQEDPNENNRIDGYIMCEPILTNGGTTMLFDPANPGQYTISGTLSHEVLETVMDRFTNTFCDNGFGVLIALEVADPVEQVGYPINVNGVNISMSDFVFPNYFNQSARLPQNAPLNYLNTLTAPFTILAGGYFVQIIEGVESQVFGLQVPEWRKIVKQAAFSRAQKRKQ
jgi:hypothetical protein